MSLVRALKNRLRLLAMSRAERRHRLVGPAHLWQEKRAFQIDFLRGQGLRVSHRFLDIGCGTLRGGIPIIEFLDAGKYCGFDTRSQCLTEAKSELKEARLEHKEPELFAAESLSSSELSGHFDRIWAFSVLIHMADEILFGSLDFVAAHLAEDGLFYANVNVGTRHDGHWQGFPVVYRTLDFYVSALAERGLACRDLGSLGDIGSHGGYEQENPQRMLEVSRSKNAD